MRLVILRLQVRRLNHSTTSPLLYIFPVDIATKPDTSENRKRLEEIFNMSDLDEGLKEKLKDWDH